MTASTIAAVFSALAAVAAAVAAWKSFALAKTAAARASDAERRNLEHDIEETARAVQVEASRATSVYTRAEPLQTSASALANSYGGSAHAEIVSGIKKTKARIVEIGRLAGSLALIPAGAELNVDDLAARLPNLRALQIEVRGILDDALLDVDRLTGEIVRLNAKREELNHIIRQPPR